MRRRAMVGALAAVAAVLVTPAVGQAGTASMREYAFWNEDGSLGDYYAPEYHAAPGETNTVEVTHSGDAVWVFADSTAPVVAGDHCEAIDEHRVTCSPPPRPMFEGRAELLDGDDSIVVSDTQFFGVSGGEGDDRLSGGPGPNALYGGPGTDILDGGAGDDSDLDGGPGADTIDGGAGRDAMSYKFNGDQVRRTPVAITLDGIRNDGADPNRSGISSPSEEADRDIDIEVAVGGWGPDRLRGNDGRNALHGLHGDDFLDGRGGPDLLDGDDGFDTVSYATRGSDAPLAITLDNIRNDGADPNRDGRSGSAEEADDIDWVERAIGGAGPDQIVGNARVNTLEGGAGNDRLDGGLAADLLNGGPDRDTISYASRRAADGVAVRLDGLRNDGSDPDGSGFSSAEEEGDLDVAVENATGGPGPDLLLAISETINVLIGNAGNDKLYARDGTTARDQLNCGEGADARQADPSDAIGSCESRIP